MNGLVIHFYAYTMQFYTVISSFKLVTFEYKRYINNVCFRMAYNNKALSSGQNISNRYFDHK